MEAGWLPRCHAWQGGWQDGWRQFFFAQLVASLGREEGEEAEEEGGGDRAAGGGAATAEWPPPPSPSPLSLGGVESVCDGVCVCV